MYPAPGIVERIGPDWDWLWLDGQHGQIAGYDQMLAMVRACDLIQRPAYVRVPACDPSRIGLALDMGAAAVIVPQIDTVEQAQAAVRAGKFPPLGNRSYGGRRASDLHGRSYHVDYKQKLVCQIESPEALEKVEQIAAVDGVDALFLGPDDLMLRCGHTLSVAPSREELNAAITAVAKACLRNDKDCICVGTTPETTALCLSLGVNYIVAGSDVGFLAGSSRNVSALSRHALEDALAKGGIDENSGIQTSIY